MANHPGTGKGGRPAFLSRRIAPAAVAALSLFASCDPLSDVVDASQKKIATHLEGQGIYERHNIPEDKSSTDIKGYYDIIGGAYRYITNEDRDDRNDTPEIVAGDRISFYFDARIFSSSFDNSTTYWTNISSKILEISNKNPQFNVADWSTDPLEINVGYDTRILKSLQNALLSGGTDVPSCRPGDIVWIYLPPDVAYGNNPLGVVPAKSTLVFELKNITIIDVELRNAAGGSEAAITAHLESDGICERDNVPGTDTSEWSADPLKIGAGNDARILKAVQNALPSCKPGDAVGTDLPPDAARGDEQKGSMPAKSRLASEPTNIEIIE